MADHNFFQKSKKPFLILIGILCFVIFVLHFKILFFETFTVPSSSMEKSVGTGSYLIVGKLNYGPRLPLTPIAIPFTHSDLSGFKPYWKDIQFPYVRIPGFQKIERNDLFVFNFPEGDTVALMNTTASYYGLCRMYGRDQILISSEIISRPVDKEDVYIKRCVALPGDLIEIRDSKLFINNQEEDALPTLQHNHDIQTSGPLNDRLLASLGIGEASPPYKEGYQTALALTDEMADSLRSFSNIQDISRQVFPKGETSPSFYGMTSDVFPYSPLFPWNRDNFGPLLIPQKGMTVVITVDSLPLYKRIIEVYEHNQLQVSGTDIFINGEKTNTYTFRMDYYWAMGDNRHNSLDSRYWGFVPEDHVVGKVVLNSSDLF